MGVEDLGNPMATTGRSVSQREWYRYASVLVLNLIAPVSALAFSFLDARWQNFCQATALATETTKAHVIAGS